MQIKSCACCAIGITVTSCSYSVEASRPLPDFVDIDQDQTLPDGILLENLKAFQTLYREHCEVGSTHLAGFNCCLVPIVSDERCQAPCVSSNKKRP